MADTNIALNKTSTASGYVLPYEPSRAVNGTISPTSRWLCNTVPANMVVDLGATYIITATAVKHMGSAGWENPNFNMCDYSLQGSNNNVNWVTIYSVVNNSLSSDLRSVLCAFRYVRLSVTKGLRVNPQYASVVELEIYGHAPNANLSALAISSGALSPTFNSNTLAYTAPKVPYGTSSVVVSATAADPTAMIKVNGVVMTGGQSTVYLNVGVNTINVQVTALDGVTTKNYTISVEREQGAILSNLAISSGTLEPAFSSEHLNYTTQNVLYDTATVTVTPTTNIPGCTITVNGNAATSGQPSPVNLNVGDNTISIVVTNGADLQTYTIAVKRESSLYLDKVNLLYTGNRFSYSNVVNMNHTTLSYTTSVDEKASQVTITPIGEDSGVSITITSNGSSQTVASGVSSSAIPLQNVVSTVSLVVSKTGVTGTKNYTLTIKKV
ncbi:cadherin-like beta sandwich domain-containing protein [Ruminiclostridium herbifermentans]|uniref:Cadherin-like beta sandwich domain-containing protein n=1 Tax=Ruminiclostridium herbifermentans TaxID=2488810 RepID=A0A4U7JFK4_9FIRM|nr:cadherin-like beta sandwich domain-containing protein [Ruminiclostridium herbifermentans]QNU67728.1 cadherin-like beta sandwich domain-containing protein [Ruminiclostridium herbifermentans]